MRTSPRRRLEPGRHAGDESLDRVVLVASDHRVVRAGHAGVGDRGRAAREHARIVRLHVRVRAEHGGDASVEVARERDLLARRLGVEVDDHDRRLAPRLLDEAVGGEERVLERVEREDAEQVDHRDAVVHREADAGRVRRHVRRAQHAVGAGEVGREALLAPVQFPSVTTSAPLASSLSASFAVIPRPAAAFSPLTMQKSASSSCASDGKR